MGGSAVWGWVLRFLVFLAAHSIYRPSCGVLFPARRLVLHITRVFYFTLYSESRQNIITSGPPPYLRCVCIGVRGY